jgi:uncharacterized membrane protein
MLVPMIALAGLTAYVALWILAKQQGALVTSSGSQSGPTSPLDEAERILAHRYAKGEISAEEYDRMLVILRR